MDEHRREAIRRLAAAARRPDPFEQHWGSRPELNAQRREFLASRRKRYDALRAKAAANGASVDIAKAVSKFLSLFSSAERPPATVQLLTDLDLPPEAAWRVIHNQWSIFDAIPHRAFQSIFAHFREGWSADYLSEDDRALYDALPERFTVYRGQDANAPVGLSWAIHRDVAAGFARGHRGLHNERPVIITAEVAKLNVAGVYADRQEGEIVLFSTATRPSGNGIGTRSCPAKKALLLRQDAACRPGRRRCARSACVVDDGQGLPFNRGRQRQLQRTLPMPIFASESRAFVSIIDIAV
jgi:hypothetical protein